MSPWHRLRTDWRDNGVRLYRPNRGTPNVARRAGCSPTGPRLRGPVGLNPSYVLNDVDQHALRLEITLKKPHRIGDRLRSNRCIKPHRIPGSFLHAPAEEARVERPYLLVDEKH